ncbi:MAG: hypothetical protein PHD32_02010 [Eubacteriales bacterium]|nr:hypothetical protein [Eubacteriales bacterium]
MASLQCKCGERMANTDEQNPYELVVIHNPLAWQIVEDCDTISFLDGMDEAWKQTGLEYWYCPECRRVSVVRTSTGQVITRYMVEEDISEEEPPKDDK